MAQVKQVEIFSNYSKDQKQNPGKKYAQTPCTQ